MTDTPNSPLGVGRLKAVFVTSENSLAEAPGGVQVYTREMLETVRAAGFDLTLVTYGQDLRLVSRVIRRLSPKPYQRMVPPDLIVRVSDAAWSGARFVFLNGHDLTLMAKPLRAALPSNCQLVMLSYGLESVDYLHVVKAVAGPNGQFPPGRLVRRLGEQLLTEAIHRAALDHVYCLSENETEIERWIGAKRVDWLPRRVTRRPLEWNPVSGYVGFVGTLNHPPNLNGLEAILQILTPAHLVRVRLAGSPVQVGQRLACRYPFVDYLGQLSDSDLEREAATWTCFLHPLFSYSRGCSTKLATALGWQIPVVATTAGCRGYTWRDGGVVLADTADKFTQEVVRLSRDEVAREEARAGVVAAAKSMPTVVEVANQFRRALLGDIIASEDG